MPALSFARPDQRRPAGRNRTGCRVTRPLRAFIPPRPDRKAPLIRCCRTTFSPLARGEGTGMRFVEIADSHPCDSASYPLLPAGVGRREAGAVARTRGCILVNAHAIPSPRGDGEKVRRQHRMRGAFGLFLQPPTKLRVRTSAAAIAPHLPRPLIRCCRTTFSPLRVAKGQLVLSQECKLHIRENACWSLLPVATGRRCGGSRG